MEYVKVSNGENQIINLTSTPKLLKRFEKVTLL